MTANTDSLPEIHLTDTLRGKKVPLVTLVPGEVGIYCCGPTVYDMSHIGHARAALAPDVRRSVEQDILSKNNAIACTSSEIRRAEVTRAPSFIPSL